MNEINLNSYEFMTLGDAMYFYNMGIEHVCDGDKKEVVANDDGFILDFHVEY